jgi:hypothetical protein
VVLLMVFQAVGLAIVPVLYLSRVNWIRERALGGLSATAVDTLLFSIVSLPLAIFAGRAVWGLIHLKRSAWLQAMSIQALLLVFALATYVLQEANALTYWALLSCIIVVMYLNTHEVRASFHADPDEIDDPAAIFGEAFESALEDENHPQDSPSASPGNSSTEPTSPNQTDAHRQ